jgi:RNA polymerase sigma-70 factor (ECF subfamily)
MGNMELRDDLLIRDYIRGNDNALNLLIRKYESKIYGYIYSEIQNKTICNDIFQETFIKVINSLKSGSYSEQGKFMPWITRISHNLIMDYHRQNKYKHTVLRYLEDIHFEPAQDETSTAENKIILDQIQKDIREILKKIPPEQKEIIMLKMYENMTHKEIAKLKNISINTSLGRYRYALINLRKIIIKDRLDLIT